MERRGIRWWRQSGFDRPGISGPTRNMASSQIACINFLLPLASIDGAMVALLRAIDDDVEGLATIEDPLAGTNSPVEFEWIGLGHALEGESVTTRGAVSTSIDAFAVAETARGRRAYLIEWKYTESYGSEGKGVGPSGETRRARYAAPYVASQAFAKDVPLDAWLYEPFYQIVRQRLLADRMVAHREHGVKEVKVVVVVPEDNAAYRRQVTSPALAAAFPDADTVDGVARATRTETSRWSASTPSPTRCGPRAAMPSCSGPDINATGTGGKSPGSRAWVPQRRSPRPAPGEASEVESRLVGNTLTAKSILCDLHHVYHWAAWQRG